MTSFLLALPPTFFDKAVQLGIRSEDVTEHFVRGSGAGGQKINKTNNCVVLRHIPTGTEVRCQKHRLQHLNRLSACKLLILKIEEKKRGKQSMIAQKIFKLRKQKKRRSTKAKEKMLQAKKHRSVLKHNRSHVE